MFFAERLTFPRLHAFQPPIPIEFKGRQIGTCNLHNDVDWVFELEYQEKPGDELYIGYEVKELQHLIKKIIISKTPIDNGRLLKDARSEARKSGKYGSITSLYSEW